MSKRIKREHFARVAEILETHKPLDGKTFIVENADRSVLTLTVADDGSYEWRFSFASYSADLTNARQCLGRWDELMRRVDIVEAMVLAWNTEPPL